MLVRKLNKLVVIEFVGKGYDDRREFVLLFMSDSLFLINSFVGLVDLIVSLKRVLFSEI